MKRKIVCKKMTELIDDLEDISMSTGKLYEFLDKNGYTYNRTNIKKINVLKEYLDKLRKNL